MSSDLSIEYDPEFDRYVVTFDATDGYSTSEIVVQTVSEIDDEDPIRLRPLGEVIDPDALDAIFDRSSGTDLGSAHLAFEYEGHEVTVFSHGRITVSEAL